MEAHSNESDFSAFLRDRLGELGVDEVAAGLARLLGEEGTVVSADCAPEGEAAAQKASV